MLKDALLASELWHVLRTSSWYVMRFKNQPMDCRDKTFCFQPPLVGLSDIIHNKASGEVLTREHLTCGLILSYALSYMPQHIAVVPSCSCYDRCQVSMLLKTKHSSRSDTGYSYPLALCPRGASHSRSVQHLMQ